MPRKRFVAKRDILPDSVYKSEMLARFINHLMLSGKKSVAEGIVYDALNLVAERHKKQQQSTKDTTEGGDEGGSTGSSSSKPAGKLSPIELLELALDNVRPTVEVRSRRVGGATYQVPVEVRQARRDTLAMRWMIDSARSRGEKGMTARLAGEILDAIGGKGTSVKKREDMHKMARANQAFAHFRWT